MELNATIHKVSIGEHDLPQIHFSVFDGGDTGMVSFLDTIGLAHATFLIENGIVQGDNAYFQMLNAFCQCEDAAELVGKEFISNADAEIIEHEKEEQAECRAGVHSWSAEIGKLHPDTPCTVCGELYGNPA